MEAEREGERVQEGIKKTFLNIKSTFLTWNKLQKWKKKKQAIWILMHKHMHRETHEYNEKGTLCFWK